MKRIPRVLPLVGLAVLGVLAVNLATGARSLPELFASATAFAEEAPGAKAEAPAPAREAAAKPAAVCAPTAAELAHEAGLSPAELRVLQSLGDRRGELDKREDDIDLQLKLLSAAEAKLDAKMKALGGLKSEISELLGQADAQSEAEAQRLVTVFSSMKSKDAAARMIVLDDSVRLPIAAKMKERTLAGILAAMPPAETKKLTESLAKRYAESSAVLNGKAAMAAETKPARKAEATPAKSEPKAG